MPAKVLVIGLGAAEATLLEKWAEEGALSAFARLAAAALGQSPRQPRTHARTT